MIQKHKVFVGSGANLKPGLLRKMFDTVILTSMLTLHNEWCFFLIHFFTITSITFHPTLYVLFGRALSFRRGQMICHSQEFKFVSALILTAKRKT